MNSYKDIVKKNKTKFSYYNPELDNCLIKHNFSEIEILYRDSKNHKPIFSENYKKGNESSNVIIIKDLINNNYIASKKFSEYYEKSLRFETFENAKLFISDIEPNLYNSEFFFKTIKLLKSGLHPLQTEHIPQYFYNEINNKLYNSINHFNICYENIKNNNTCNNYLPHNLIIKYNIKYKPNNYSIIVNKKYQNEKEIYDLIIPCNKIEYNSKLILKPELINNLNTFNINEKDENCLKIIKTIYNYFVCCYKQKTYIPPIFVKDNSFLVYILEHPSIFIDLLEKTSREIEKNILLK